VGVRGGPPAPSLAKIGRRRGVSRRSRATLIAQIATPTSTLDIDAGTGTAMSMPRGQGHAHETTPNLAGAKPGGKRPQGYTQLLRNAENAYTVASSNNGVTQMKTFNELAHEYRPYHEMPAFQKGAEAYMDRNYECPYSDGLRVQAWDRGMECAMRFTRQHGRYA
jgi:hypothetical protein